MVLCALSSIIKLSSYFVFVKSSMSLEVCNSPTMSCFDHVDWDMFRAASDDDIEAYSDTVTCFIRK